MKFKGNSKDCVMLGTKPMSGSRPYGFKGCTTFAKSFATLMTPEIQQTFGKILKIIMERFKLILVALMIFYLTGCAWTTLNTVKNPELSQVKFRKILIVAPFSDIGLRKQTENAFLTQFNLLGINAVPSIELIPPLKDYTEQDLLKILEQNNIDGVLVVALQDYWTSQVYIPKRSLSQGSASLFGNSLYYQSYTQEYGGYYISKPRVKFEIRLFDVQTGQVAWLATSLTRGNAFADYNTLVTSLAKEEKVCLT